MRQYVLLNTLFPCFLAHLSRRLIGELIVYTWYVVVVVVVHNSHASISSEIAWPIKAKFHVQPGKGVNGPGYMTKMAAMSIYGGNLKKSSRTGSPMILKLGMQHWGFKLYKVCINGDPGLTMTYFTVRSYWVT